MDNFIATEIKSNYNIKCVSWMKVYLVRLWVKKNLGTHEIRGGASEPDDKMWGIYMSRTDEEIKRFETKMKSCTTMTDLIVAMSSWQSYAQSHNLDKEQRRIIDEAYLKAEERLITTVKPSLW